MHRLFSSITALTLALFMGISPTPAPAEVPADTNIPVYTSVHCGAGTTCTAGFTDVNNDGYCDRCGGFYVAIHHNNRHCGNG